jgi:hypothetical protein
MPPTAAAASRWREIIPCRDLLTRAGIAGRQSQSKGQQKDEPDRPRWIRWIHRGGLDPRANWMRFHRADYPLAAAGNERSISSALF